MRKLEDDEKALMDFNQYYKYGRNVGGGSPIKDARGQVISQHVPFSAQSQANGGLELNERQQFARNNNAPV
jgi:hypothetical protein